MADFDRNILIRVQVDGRGARSELAAIKRELEGLTRSGEFVGQITGTIEEGFGGLVDVAKELRLDLKALSTGLDVFEVAAQDGRGAAGRLSQGMSVLRAVTLGATQAGRGLLTSLASFGSSAASAALPVAGLTLGIGALALAFAGLATGGLLLSIRGLADFIGYSTEAGQEAQRLANAVTSADQRLSAAIGKVAYDTTNLDQITKALYVNLSNLVNIAEESGQTFTDFSLGMIAGVREGLVFLDVLDKIQEKSSLLGGAIQTLALGPFGALRSSTQEQSRLFDQGVTQADRYAEALGRLRQAALGLSPTLSSIGAGGVGQIGELAGTSVDLGAAQRAFRESLIDSRKRPEGGGKKKKTDAGPLAKGVVGTITGAAGSEGVTGQAELVSTVDQIRQRMATLKQEALDTFASIKASMEDTARSEATSRMVDALKLQTEQWGQIKQAVAGAAAGFAISSAQIVGALAGQGGAWKALQASALQALGNLSAQLGSFYLFAGLGAESLGFLGLQGAGAIGAGLGLIALGATLSGAGAYVGREERSRGAGQGSSAAGGGGGSASYAPSLPQSRPSTNTFNFVIEGQRLATVIAPSLEEMASLGRLNLGSV